MSGEAVRLELMDVNGTVVDTVDAILTIRDGETTVEFESDRMLAKDWTFRILRQGKP